MRIGLIADSHIPTLAEEIPSEVKNAFESVDLILHAGDIQMAKALDWLETIAPVIAATGNNDYFFEDPRMQEVQIIDIEGFRIGMIHVFTYPERGGLSLQHYFKQKFNGPVDIIIYGDTHVPEVLFREGILMVNPGSPTSPGPNMYLGLGHVGILDINNGKAQSWIVSIKDQQIYEPAFIDDESWPDFLR